uniref:BZIP domain-containing protein n=1 Tax=Picea sitchensis TaxID=3332 RepID=D5A9G3_PICSI|nr:unknown [Picea sitchensis]
MADSSSFEEIQWDFLLQDLPQSPKICLDELALPLSSHYFNEDPRNEYGDQVLRTCNGGDNINTVVNLYVTEEGEAENLSSEPPLDSSVLELSALSEILLSDDGLENYTFDVNGVEPNEFLDIDSFLVGICSSQQQPSQDDEGALNIQPSCDAEAPENGGELSEEGGEKLGTCGRKRKRNRDSASKSREKKKVYVRSLETKCRRLERERGNLEEALRYSALENATLRNELNGMNKKNSMEEADKTEVVSWSVHGGRKTEEPAVLVVDSPQKEFVFCVVMMRMILPVLLFLMACKFPRAPRKKEMASQEQPCLTKKNGTRMILIFSLTVCVGVGESLRKWIWCRKRMKLCLNRW